MNKYFDKKQKEFIVNPEDFTITIQQQYCGYGTNDVVCITYFNEEIGEHSVEASDLASALKLLCSCVMENSFNSSYEYYSDD